MFLELDLTNFRQHRHLNVQFTPGLNAVRGLNEAGKTSLIEAIMFALFGARSLREPLEHVVTWGEKESSLRVMLDFSINGAIYNVVRSKSGAQLMCQGVVKATGQDGVKTFIEELFGVKADVATKMMMASQKSLQGALEDGPGAAVKLIETLANFSLIDQIISLVQAKLPNGNTSVVESQIAMLEGQIGDAPVDPTTPLAAVLSTAQRGASQAADTVSSAREAWTAIQPDAMQADVVLKTYKDLTAQLERSQGQVVLRTAELQRINPVPGPTELQITELRQQVADQTRLTRARAAQEALRKLPDYDSQWEGDRASLQTELDAERAAEVRLRQEMHQQTLARTVLEGQLIKETTCAFCEKDLTDVPEVIQRNSALAPRILACQTDIGRLEAELATCRDNIALYVRVLGDDDRVNRIFRDHADFLSFDRGFVPADVTYSGPRLDVHADQGADPQVSLRRAEADVATYQRALGQQQQAAAQLAQAVAATTALRAQVDAAKAGVEQAEVTLGCAAQLGEDLTTAERLLQEAQAVVKERQGELDHAKQLYQQQLTFRQTLQAQLKIAKGNLKAMTESNNLLIKLRKARPKVADELWGIVNAAVSKHFSDIRGVPSVVSREDNDFKVDGHSIKGLSGSTLDALGLAIRIGLTKTFLPNTSFMSLDEPAAACDDERELNMLGMVSASGFEQVLLVTHSDQCESFANNVVRL